MNSKSIQETINWTQGKFKQTLEWNTKDNTGYEGGIQ
jgi:hypothetical protein